MKVNLFTITGICIVMFFVLSQVILAQSIDNIKVPMVDGERELTFRINTNNLRPEVLKVSVYYSDSESRLKELSDDALPQGRPSLLLDRSSTQFLDAMFVFPHDDFPRDPNRSLYALLKRNSGTELVAYRAVDDQLKVADLLPPGTPFLSEIPSPIDSNPRKYAKGACVYYRIQISANAKVAFTSEIQSFRMPDTYNIAVAGDSYAAGEGAPDDQFELLGDNSDMWTDSSRGTNCHRSNRSGFIRGIKRFIQNNPATAVDYFHAACSGATVTKLTAEEQDNNNNGEFGIPHPVQFKFIKDDFLIKQKHDELHLLLLSIGGNDAGFAAYVINYMYGNVKSPLAPPNAAMDVRLPSMIKTALDRLKGTLYVDLNEVIKSDFPSAQVAIATYPDPTYGPRGRCGVSRGLPDFLALYYCCLVETKIATNPAVEYAFTSDEYVKPLNDAIKETAAGNEFRWNVIDVESRIGSHGVCNCTEPYVNTLAASVSIQSDMGGTAHPNAAGYRKIYEQPVSDSVSDLYSKFVRERTRALFVAAHSGVDDSNIRLTPPCLTSVSPVMISSSIATFINSNGLADNYKWLKDYLSDEDVRKAMTSGDVAKLKILPARNKLLLHKTEATKLINESFPKQRSRKATVPELLKPDRLTIEEQANMRAYLKSKEFQDLVEAIKTGARAMQRKDEKDELDSLFNRQ